MSEGADHDGRDPARGDVEDVLDLGAEEPRWYSRAMDPMRRHPRGTRAALWLTTGLAIGIALVSGLQATGSDNAARPSDSAPTDSAAAPQTKEQAAVASVLALTNRGGRLTDYLRQTSPSGACAIVPVGHPATVKITKTIERTLPDYKVVDVGRTIDQFTGLCSVEMRAMHSGGRATLVVSIASPPAHTRETAYTLLETGIVTRAETTTKYVSAVTQTGWRVLLGASGAGNLLPSAQDLVQLAQNPALLW